MNTVAIFGVGRGWRVEVTCCITEGDLVALLRTYSRISAVGIVARLDGPGGFPAGAEIFSTPKRPDRL